MRNRFLYPMFFLLVLASGCSKDEDSPLPENGSPFVLQVEAEGYRPTALTCATESFLTTTFAKNDRIGVIITHPDNSMEHVVYTYNGYSWTTATAPLYYDSKDVYSAYYPYRWDLEGKSLEEIKSAFELVADQSDYATGYSTSDLMTCERAEMSDDKKLKITLSHVFSQLRMPTTEPVKSECGNGKTYEYGLPVTGIVFYVNDIPCRPWIGGDGYARLIVKNSDVSVPIKSCYTTTREERVETDVPGQTFASGFCYTISVPVSDLGKYENYRMGDYLCKDSQGDFYVLPSEIEYNEETDACIGIVFYVGRHEKDNSDYTIPLTENGPVLADGTVHGYAVALTDVHNSSSDRLRWEYGPNGEWNQSVNASTDINDWSGYDNCRKIHEFVETNATSGWKMQHFPAALACETYGNRTIDRDGNPTTAYAWQQPLIAPNNSSGWFLPSCDQLYYCWQNRTFLSNCINMVKNKTSNTTLKNHIGWFSPSLYYWSFTDYLEDYARSVGFSGGSRNPGRKNSEYVVRAVVAF